MQRTRDTKKGKRRRALTIYFPSLEQKEALDKLADGFGLSASALGLVLIVSGMRQGFKVMSGAMTMAGSVVESESSAPTYPEVEQPKRPRPISLLKRLSGRSS